MDRILIVDDEFLIRYTLEEGLKDRGYDAYSAATVEEGLEFVRKYHPGVLLLDNLLENSVGMDEIVNFKNADEELQVIMMTAYGSVSQAVEATKRGAYDYILKPFDVDEIDMLIKRCLEQKRNRDSLVFLKGDVPQFLGVSEAAARIRHLIQVLGENLSVNVLLRGETGTGKEVVARQIHANSARKDNLMVRINCGAIPENLMESELFGYERGAFAGALKTKKGLIELADGGTVFLDEIGELPMAMQTKLLTFLDDRKFKRIGALEDTAVDVRIIAATNRNLEEAIKAGQFREDLFRSRFRRFVTGARISRYSVTITLTIIIKPLPAISKRWIRISCGSCSCTTGREMSGSLKIFLSAVFSSAREISWKNTWSWRRSSGRQGRRAGTASI